MRWYLAITLWTSCAQLVSGQDAGQSPARSPASSTGEAALSDAEQRELRTALDLVAAREHEYREAVLNAQAAQARLEAINSAMEVKFYKICGAHKLDPDKFELTPDTKAIRPRTTAPVKPPSDTSRK